MDGRDIKRRPNILVILAFLFISCACILDKGSAQGAKDEVKRTSITRELTGEVTWIRGDRIAVVFERNKDRGSEEEILLPVASDVRIVHKKSLDQIAAGDMVRIQYEEVTEEWPDGRRNVERKVKVISFLRAAAKRPIAENTIAEQKALISQ